MDVSYVVIAAIIGIVMLWVDEKINGRLDD